ncbi:MAG: response regulator transcription factor, partial [Spongiibacteraceae bacterium]|nr:response regulator transcription factor [Spongiibacteraceae bacterium]
MRVLIIEDHEDIAECVQQSLADMGIASDKFAESRHFSYAAKSVDYDLLILDLNLPDADGLDLLREFRKLRKTTPVLITSARISVSDRVAGLDLGADDYLPKPFDLNELEARVRALLRRGQATQSPTIELGALVFNQTSRDFFIDGQAMDLPPRERAVLEILLRHNGSVISKERIAEHVFNFDDATRRLSIQLLPFQSQFPRSLETEFLPPEGLGPI